MPSTCPAEFVDFATRLAAESGPIIRRYFRTPVDVDAKGDATPVTVADREAEAAMRALIERTYPGHGIIGEEHGTANAGAEHVWVLDPIDGTKSFITGRPIFGTLIGLLQGGHPVLGVIDQPVIGERWIGVDGDGTSFNGERSNTRRCTGLALAIMNTTGPDLFIGSDRDAFDRLSSKTRHTVYGGDCYAYGQLANGHVDLVVEAGLQVYDYCALVPVVEGAGGSMSDWQGKPLSTESDGRVIAVGDRALLDRALEELNADPALSGPRA